MCLKQSHIKRDVWHQKAAYPVCQISKPPQGFYIPDISIRQAPIILVCLFNKVFFLVCTTSDYLVSIDIGYCRNGL